MTGKPFLALIIAVAFAACSKPQQATAAAIEGSLFDAPSAAEIAAADRWWKQQRQAISSAAVIGNSTLATPQAEYEVHPVEYLLNGERRCGAVLWPNGTPNTTVVDLSDIRWDYPPRDISRGAHITTVLGERAPNAVVLIPCFRGMVLRINDFTLSAAGQRDEAWAEAALDASAFLSVALQLFPNLPEDTVAYGYSRGGGVALLLGQRDQRIDRVAAFAAPTDFFDGMRKVSAAQWERTLAARVTEGNLPEDSRAYQYVDWFFDEPRDRGSIRERLLRASPLYFVQTLPPTRIYQGSDDGPVPARNAQLLKAEAKRLNRSDITVRIFEGAGHMLRASGAYEEARPFIVPLAAE